jgi:ABC-type amino acid transport substrate-binding protein
MEVGRMRRFLSAVVAAVVTTGLTACGISIPSDPDGTLDRVTGGVLEVGVTPNPPHTDTSGTHPAGTEPALVASFAESIDARVEWVEGSEQSLVQLLEIGELDLVIGGISEQTPWSDRVAVTRAYAEAELPDGSTSGLVMLAPMGENAFLSALERHLDAETEGER